MYSGVAFPKVAKDSELWIEIEIDCKHCFSRDDVGNEFAISYEKKHFSTDCAPR